MRPSKPKISKGQPHPSEASNRKRSERSRTQETERGNGDSRRKRSKSSIESPEASRDANSGSKYENGLSSIENSNGQDDSIRKAKKRRAHPQSARSKARKSKIQTPPAPPKEPLLTRIKAWFDTSHEPEVSDVHLRNDSTSRLKLGGGLLGLGLSILMMRAGYLMLWPNQQLETVTKEQYEHTETIRGRRGDITDRNGHLMATSVTLHEIIVSPIHIPTEHLDLVVSLLVEHLGVDGMEIKQKIIAKQAIGSQYLVVAKEVTPLAYQNLQRALRDVTKDQEREFRKSFSIVRSQGISQKENTYRYYTGKSDAAPLLGGFSQYNHRGVSGLELQYDKKLRGSEFATIRIRDRQNQSVFELTPEEMAPQAQDGKNLVTTIDRRIQHVTDEALAKAVETTKAHSGFAVVVDVKTGEILASSTQPTANINDSTVFQEGVLTHHGLVDSYEAGSVLKPLIVASALNEGLFTPNTLIDCHGGYWRVHGVGIRDDHPKNILTVTEVIQHSSNIGAAKVALELGKENTIEYLRNFGLGQETGLGFPAEPKGILRSPSRVKPIELITMSYGYGLTTTLTQLAMAYAALGNDGMLMKPMLVKELTTANGDTVERFEPTELKQVVSPQVAKQMLTIMQTVVTDGTAKNAKVPGYSVAGKTGTAKKAAKGGYSDTDRIGSFVGLIPADNPRLAIAISIDTPTEGLAYGGVVAAPAFAEIAEASMKILGVEPNVRETLEDVVVQTKFDEPPPPKEIIWTEKGEIIVPNLSGLTLRDALSTLQVANLNLRFKGSGRVVQQFPAAGTHIAPQEALEIVLQ